MQARLPPSESPDAIAAVRALDDHVESCALEPGLLDLARTHASQISRCTFRIDARIQDAPAARAWSASTCSIHGASPLYGAALGWTEALTQIALTHAPDAGYKEAREQFAEDELVKLTVAIGVINPWNRLAIGFSPRPPGQRVAGRVSPIGRTRIMSLDHRHRLGLAGGAAALALCAGLAPERSADAADGATVTPVFAYDLPHLPGQKMTGVLVEYAPGAGSPPHHHTSEGSVVAFVIEGAIRSQVNDGAVTVYRGGESWLEPPGAAHSVSENASATEPARLLAVFVAQDGAELTTFDK